MLTHAPVQPGDVPGSLQSAADAAPARESRTRGRFGRVRGQFSRYASSLLWVIRDALPRFRLQVAAVIFCNIIGLAAAFSAVGGVMAYARAAEHDGPMRLLGREWKLAGDVNSLLLFGAGIALLGLVSATCTYITDRLILASARTYHTFCADRAIAIAADPLCLGWQVMLDDSPRAILSRMAGGASRVMGLVLRDILRVILPLLTVVATIAFLFYIDSTLTLVLLPATGLYLLPLYLINRRVTRMQREYRTLSPQARSDVGRRLREMLQAGSLPAQSEQMRRDTLQSATYQGALAALYGRLLADRRVQLLNAAFFIVCLVALLIFFGIQARDHARPWSDLIFYIVALRFAMTSLKQTTSLGAKFSRFFPEYHAYATFVDDANHTRVRRLAEIAHPRSVPEMLTLRLGRNVMWDSVRALRFRSSCTLIILTPIAPGHADLEAMLLRLEHRMDDDVDLSTRAEFAAQSDRLDDPQFGAAPVLVLSGNIAGRSRTAPMLMGQPNTASRLLVIVHDDPRGLLISPLIQGSGDWHAIVSDGVRFVAGGGSDWFRAHIAEIEVFIREQADTVKRRGGIDEALDDDEAEDAA